MTIQSNSPNARGRIRQIPLPSEGSQRAVRERSERHQRAITCAIRAPSGRHQGAIRAPSERHQSAIRWQSDGHHLARARREVISGNQEVISGNQEVISGNQEFITSPVLDESDQTPSGVRLTAPTIVLKTASTSAGAPIAGSLPPRTSASHRAPMPRLSEQV